MLKEIDWSGVKITKDNIGRLYTSVEKTPNDIEREASEMIEKDIVLESSGEVRVNEETQLDRIEKKLDRLLEERKLSVSMDGKEVGKLLNSDDLLIRSKTKGWEE